MKRRVELLILSGVSGGLEKFFLIVIYMMLPWMVTRLLGREVEELTRQ